MLIKQEQTEVSHGGAVMGRLNHLLEQTVAVFHRQRAILNSHKQQTQRAREFNAPCFSLATSGFVIRKESPAIDFGNDEASGLTSVQGSGQCWQQLEHFIR